MEFLNKLLEKDLIIIPDFSPVINGYLASFLISLFLLIAIDQAFIKFKKGFICKIIVALVKKHVKSMLKELHNSVSLRDGIQPIKWHKNIRKLFSYLECGAWFYGFLIFLTLSGISILMFAMKSHELSIDRTFLAVGLIIVLSWAARFAYIETRVTYVKAKRIE